MIFFEPYKRGYVRFTHVVFKCFVENQLIMFDRVVIFKITNMLMSSKEKKRALGYKLSGPGSNPGMSRT